MLLFLAATMPTWAKIGLVVLGCIVVGIILGVIKGVISSKDDAQNEQAATDGSTASASGSGAKPSAVGDSAEYCRWCRDCQPVIERTPEQKKLVDKYFIVKNVETSNKALLGIGIVAMLVGIILAVVFFASGLDKKPLIVIGAILIVVGIIFFILYSKSFHRMPPSDLISHEAYEQAVKDKIKEMNVARMGLLHLGLDEEQIREIKPVVFTDYEVIGTSLRAYDADKKKVHSSTQSVMYIYFTDEQIYVYKLQFDMCCNKQEEWTSEFFYADICDVSTYINKNVLDIGVATIEYSTLKVNIVATNSEISFSMENDKTAYASVHAMRQKVRERKMR